MAEGRKTNGKDKPQGDFEHSTSNRGLWAYLVFARKTSGTLKMSGARPG